MHWQLGNHFIPDSKERKALSRAREAVFNLVAVDWLDRTKGYQDAARYLQIIGSVVKSIKIDIPCDSQEMVYNHIGDE